MPTSIPRSVTDPWVKGHTYEIIYHVSAFKVLGIPVPIESLKRRAFEHQCESLLDKLRVDSRWRVLSARKDFDRMEFSVKLLAMENPFPILLVVGAIIGLAVLFGLTLLVGKVTELVQSGTGELELDTDGDGKPDVSLAIPLIPLLALAGLFLFANK